MRRIIALLISMPLFVLAAEWQSLGGPPAGRADDMSIGHDPELFYWVIYAADKSHKLYKSTDQFSPLGEHWDSIVDPNIIYPTCVITHRNNSQIVYVGKNDAVPVWKSANGGVNWDPKSTGITNTNPLCFAMDPTDWNIVYSGFEWYTGIDYTIFKTVNGGEQWDPCGSLSVLFQHMWEKLVKI